MSITNYGELKTAVQEWLYDNSSVTAYASDFITLAQGYLNRVLRCREMVTQTDISISSGLYALPADYLEWRHVVEKASIRRPLNFISLASADNMFPDRPSGLASHFTVIGSNIRCYPTPTNDIELTYYAKIAALSADSDTDWLLTKMPNLYLSTSLMYAAEFIKDDEEAAKHKGLADLYIEQIRSEDQMNTLANSPAYIDGITP